MKKMPAPLNPGLASRTQRGAAMIVGTVIIVILLLAAAGFGYVALTQKEGVQLQVETPEVGADDLLTTGKSNNELLIDRLIVQAGLKRDGQQQKTTNEVLDDEALPVGDGVTTSTTVEASRLSQLQTEFISESDRRLKKLDAAMALTGKLPVEQKTSSQKYINDEITALTGLKAKSAAETARDGFLTDRDDLDKEYVNYLMVVTQVYLLQWANDQTILGEKVNVLGGKFQERLNSASNSGESIAAAQTQLNSYQSDKTAAKDNTAKALENIAKVQPGTFSANKAVLEQYANQLSTANASLKRATDTSVTIITQIKTYK